MKNSFPMYLWKGTALAAAFFLLFFQMVFPFAADYDSHWAKEDIEYLIEENIVEGTPEGVLPEHSLLRAELAKLVNRTAGFQETPADNFPDVSDEAWYAGEMAIAKKAGYLQGDPNGHGNPEAAVTRSELMTVLARVYRLDTSDTSLPYYKDEGEIPFWARGAIQALVKKGLVNGYDDGTIRPNQLVTRAECFSVLARMMRSGITKENPPAETVSPSPSPIPGVSGGTVHTGSGSAGGSSGSSSSSKPAKPSGLFLSKENGKLIASWNPVPLASGYCLSLFINGQAVLSGTAADEPRLDVTSSINAAEGGDIMFQVQTLSSGRRSSWAVSPSYRKLETPLISVSEEGLCITSVSGADSYHVKALGQKNFAEEFSLPADTLSVSPDELMQILQPPESGSYSLMVQAAADSTAFDSKWSQSAEIVFSRPEMPGNVTGLSAVPGDGAVTLSWTEPENAEEKGFAGVTILCEPGGKILSADKGTISFTVEGLINGTEYHFTVKSVGPSGLLSNGVSVSAVPEVPGKPSITGGTVTSYSSIPLADHVDFRELNFTLDRENQSVKYVSFDPNSGYVLVPFLAQDTVLGGQTVIEMARELESRGYEVIAGVNADFFNMDSALYGVPQGMMVIDGELICSQLESGVGVPTRHGLGITADNKLALTQFSQSSNNCGPKLIKQLRVGSTAYDVATINRPMQFSKGSFSGISMFTRHYAGNITADMLGENSLLCEVDGGRLNINQTSSLRILRALESSRDYGSLSESQVILTLKDVPSDILNHFQSLKQDDVLTINLQIDEADSNFKNVRTVLGSMYTPLIGGNVKQYAPTVVAGKKDCRISFGIRADGTMVLAYLDGDDTASRGFNITEEGNLMKDLGCTDAVNFDAGGSASLILRRDGVLTAEVSYGRRVANALFLCRAK